MKRRILFYSNVRDTSLFKIQSFYRVDVDILKQLGYDVTTTNTISSFFKFRKYDIAFLYFYRYSFFCALFAKLFRKKTVFTGGIDNLDKTYASSSKYLVQKIFFMLCNLVSDHNIIVSTSDLRNIDDIYKRPFSNFTLSFHSIDFPSFDFTLCDIKKEKIITSIGWMGSLDNVLRKGIDKTVLAFKMFYDKHPDFKLIIAGYPGDGSKYIIKLIEDLGLSEVVEYKGAISEEDKINLLLRSTLYSQLSIYEGFGIAAVEALAAGNIVVHSGRGGLKDAVGENGVCVDINSIEKIYEGFEHAYYLSQTTTAVHKAVKYVRDHFTFDKRLNDFDNILSYL